MAITLKLDAVLSGTITLSTESVKEFAPAIRDAAENGYLSDFGTYLLSLLDKGEEEEAIKTLLKHSLRMGLKDFQEQFQAEVLSDVQGNYKFAPAVVRLTRPLNTLKAANEE
ncbi:Gp5.5-like host HNS inhibition [Cronobacter phage Dev-CD-23823]|uniref:Uncharacterized protein n=1 Tax=Cronobacter phage Dev-CD-23823 TaxID=1712539 RepID=A0A0K8IWK1_9CAUD|nr:Gp5.5-like host HNS inhibition [Cronobacter phage Dev-CD-23823]CUH74588.1 hypothetical protein [Cronobacter phage Dev-CD-23823]